MTETDFKKVCNYHKYRRYSKIITEKSIVNIDDGSQGGSHWTCFHIKDNKSLYFDSFGSQLDNFLLKQLPKPITFRNIKTQDTNSSLCGSYCLYFFYLMERMDYYNAILIK